MDCAIKEGQCCSHPQFPFWVFLHNAPKRYIPVAFSRVSYDEIIRSFNNSEPSYSKEFFEIYSAEGICKNTQHGMCNENLGGTIGLEIAWSPDGSRLAVVGREVALLWDTSTSKILTLCGHEPIPGAGRVISDVEFSPDGNQLATAGDNGTIRLWNASTGEPIATLFGHNDKVTRIAFSPDGQRLVTASFDGTVSQWDVASRRQITRFEFIKSIVVDSIPGNAIVEVAFSSDGRSLTAVSKDGTVNVYYTRVEDLMNLACARVSRNLTSEEWERYITIEPYRPTCNLPVSAE